MSSGPPGDEGTSARRAAVWPGFPCGTAGRVLPEGASPVSFEGSGGAFGFGGSAGGFGFATDRSWGDAAWLGCFSLGCGLECVPE